MRAVPRVRLRRKRWVFMFDPLFLSLLYPSTNRYFDEVP